MQDEEEKEYDTKKKTHIHSTSIKRNFLAYFIINKRLIMKLPLPLSVLSCWAHFSILSVFFFFFLFFYRIVNAVIRELWSRI